MSYIVVCYLVISSWNIGPHIRLRTTSCLYLCHCSKCKQKQNCVMYAQKACNRHLNYSANGQAYYVLVFNNFWLVLPRYYLNPGWWIRSVYIANFSFFSIFMSKSVLTLQTFQDETSVDSVVYKECMFYLRTYGTYSDHLRFLLQNGYWNKALKFLLDHVSDINSVLSQINL